MIATKAPKTKTTVGLPDTATEEISDKLNSYLGNLHVLYTKLHNLHWNIEGASFFPLHEELQSMYEAVAEEIAEHLVSDLQMLITQLRETISLSQEQGDDGTAAVRRASG